MLRTLSVTIPAAEVAAMCELLVTLHAVKAESAARGSPGAPGELAALGELVERAEIACEAGASLELSGPPGLVRDAVYGLLLDGVDALADACRAYESGRSSMVELVRAGESAQARLAIMKRVESDDGWSPG
jgi:hypothetical protein